MSQGQVHAGTVTMGVTPIVTRPLIGIAQASVIHQGRVSVGGTTQTVTGRPA